MHSPGRMAKGCIASGDAGSTWADASSGLGNLDVRSLAFGLDGIAAGTNAGVALSPDGHVWHDGGLDRYSISAVAVAANFPQFTVIAGADGAISGTLASGIPLQQHRRRARGRSCNPGLPSGALVSSITAGQIDAAVPKRPLIVATSQGIFRSGDGGATWTAGDGGPQALTLTVGAVRAARSEPRVRGGGRRWEHRRRLLPIDRRGAHLPQGRHGSARATARTSRRSPSPTPRRPRSIVALNPPTGGSHVYIESRRRRASAAAARRRGPGSTRSRRRCRRPMPTATPVPQADEARYHHAAGERHPALRPGRRSTGRRRWSTRSSSCSWRSYVFIRWRQRYYVEGPP